MKKIVVIGNGKFVVDCLKVMNGVPEASVELVISDPKIQTMGGLVQRYCADHNTPHLETAKINSDQTLNAVKSAKPDYLFSVYNLQIIKPPLLAIPTTATVNYHNGPLPKYGGVNVYSWAIINGEKQFGVTWHYVDEGIDTGDIITQKMFLIDNDETPFTLARKCFKAGAQLLEETIVPMLRNKLKSIPQDKSQASYFSMKDTPNEGRVDFRWSFEQFERFVRGLNFAPLENSFVYPTARFGNKEFHLQKVVRLSDISADNEAGKIQGIEQNTLRVFIGDAVVGITELLDADKQPISAGDLATRYGMQAGNRLE